jgi:hypothetical protein
MATPLYECNFLYCISKLSTIQYFRYSTKVLQTGDALIRAGPPKMAFNVVKRGFKNAGIVMPAERL